MSHFLPLFQRLVAGTWYTMRSASCGLFHVVYPLVNDSVRSELLKWLAKLHTDSAVMVRRAVAEEMKKLVPVVAKDELVSVLHPIFLRLVEDEQDSVRLLAAGLCTQFAQSLTPKDATAAALPTFQKCATDASWRVRYVVASEFSALAAAIPGADLLPQFVALLGDSESEVRASAAEKVLEFCLLLPEATRSQQVISGVLPLLKNMVSDESEHVRTALAGVIMGISSVLGKDKTIAELLPLFLKMLKDSNSEVRLKIIQNLDEVNKVIGIGPLAQALLPAIDELASNEAWRTRLAIVEVFPVVSQQVRCPSRCSAITLSPHRTNL